MVKPREKRVPIMMSEDEMLAIDDWRFANRIATRSDAIRRLCRIGLVIDAQFDDLWKRSVRIDKIATDFPNAIASAKDRSRTEAQQNERIAARSEQVARELFDLAGDLLVTVDKILRQTWAYKTPGSFEEAVAEAADKLNDLSATEERLRSERERKREVSKRIEALNVEKLGKAVLDAVAGSSEEEERSAVLDTVAEWLSEQRETQQKSLEDRIRRKAEYEARKQENDD